MRCKTCNDLVDPFVKKEDDRIEFHCPNCKERLGTTFLIEFTDEELESLERGLSSKTPQEINRYLRKRFDDKLEK